MTERSGLVEPGSGEDGILLDALADLVHLAQQEHRHGITGLGGLAETGGGAFQIAPAADDTRGSEAGKRQYSTGVTGFGLTTPVGSTTGQRGCRSPDGIRTTRDMHKGGVIA